MAKHRMDVATFVGKLLEQDDVDSLREGVRVLAQLVMEREVSARSAPSLTSGARTALPTETATAPAPGTPESARSSSRSPR